MLHVCVRLLNIIKKSNTKKIGKVSTAVKEAQMSLRVSYRILRNPKQESRSLGSHLISFKKSG